MDKGYVMSKKFRFLLAGLVACTICLSTCKRNTPAPTKNSKSKAIFVMGGLGGDQTGEIANLLINRYKDSFDIITFSQNDGYKGNLAEAINSGKYQYTIVIPHSFGCDTTSKASYQAKMDLVMMIDPVATDWGKLTPDVNNIGRLIVFRRTQWFGPKTAEILIPHEEVEISGGHNDLPHDQEVYDKIVEEIDKL